MIFVIRGTTVHLSCLFKNSSNEPVNPEEEPTINIFYYNEDSSITTVVADNMTTSGVVGRYHYKWQSSTDLVPYTVLFVEYKAVDGDNNLDLEDAITVLDFGGFSGGMRAVVVG